jgi:Mrp family chromosome partitioning ATPase
METPRAASQAVEVQAQTSSLDLEEEMLSLYKSIDTMLPHLDNRILQFIGARDGEGTSTIVREFARIAATKIGKTVLLLDADRHQPCQHNFFCISQENSWIETLYSGEDIAKAAHQVKQSRLFVSPSANSYRSTPLIFDSPRVDQFWGMLKTKFDLVLIDSAPLTQSPDALAIASRVDGVILVVEADKTRWQTVNNVKEHIVKVGGSILGIAFNKRRYHIPQAIYKLF